MCGIFGVITNQDNISLGKVVLEGIKRLEYRGYDSCGIVALSNSKLYVKKDSGLNAQNFINFKRIKKYLILLSVNFIDENVELLTFLANSLNVKV